MSRVKKVWRVGEKPVKLAVLYSPMGLEWAGFECPGCGQHVETEVDDQNMLYVCRCGARLGLRVEPTLEELEEEEAEGE